MVGGDEAAFERAQAGHRSLCAHGEPDRPGGRRPAHQDGQPDLHRRPGSGARGSASTSPRRPGLDVEKVMETISKGAAQSWQMENRWKTMSRGQVRLRLRRGLDAQGSRRSARRGAPNGASLPVTALVDQFYAEVQAMGGQTLGHLEPDRAAQSGQQGVMAASL